MLFQFHRGPTALTTPSGYAESNNFPKFCAMGKQASGQNADLAVGSVLG